MSSCLCKILPINYSFTNHMLNIYMHKQDLALNTLQGLICHKPKQPSKQPSNQLKI